MSNKEELYEDEEERIIELEDEDGNVDYKTVVFDFGSLPTDNYTVAINEITEDSLLISDDSDTQADNRESLQLVTLLMNKLPEQQRQVLQLRAFNECSFEEIESITGLTSVNVRTLLSRGRRRLKELYNQVIN